MFEHSRRVHVEAREVGEDNEGRLVPGRRSEGDWMAEWREEEGQLVLWSPIRSDGCPSIFAEGNNVVEAAEMWGFGPNTRGAYVMERQWIRFGGVVPDWKEISGERFLLLELHDHDAERSSWAVVTSETPMDPEWRSLLTRLDREGKNVRP